MNGETTNPMDPTPSLGAVMAEAPGPAPSTTSLPGLSGELVSQALLTLRRILSGSKGGLAKTDQVSEPELRAALSTGTPEEPGMVSMDPRLQRLVAERRRGILKEATASTSEDEVAVIARVSTVKKWEELSEVVIGATIGGKGGDGSHLVTGRIPVTRIENVRTRPFVISLKAAQPVQPVLFETIEETGAREDLLPNDHLANGGDGVVIGIVDYGGDFAHENFRNEDGSSRIEALWHQGGNSGSGSPFGYGREYLRSEINRALETPNPYSALGYFPGRSSHGTHVMDIAAGNGRGSGTKGVAPEADIVFVDVSHADIPFLGPDVVESSFGDSTRLLEALRYIFEKAGPRPCVINVSLGTNGGPHDGSTLVEDGIDRLVSQAENRAVVIAASNSFDDGIHASGSVAEGGHVDLEWVVPPGDFSHNEFELWYPGSDRLAVELIAPNGLSLGLVEPGSTLPLEIEGSVVVFVANRLDDPNNHDNMIGIFLEQGLPAGSWIVRVHGLEVRDGSFHAWIERDNTTQSSFAPPHDNTHTIGSISTGRQSIVVGSYDAHKGSRPISFFSSAGPTRDGREKPEVSAPGHAVRAASSATLTGTVRKSGTSMASPAVAGITALVLAEARARGLDLSSAEIRQILVDASRRNPPFGANWDDRFGHGRLSAERAVQAVIDLAGSGSAAAGKQATKKSARKDKTAKASRKRAKSGKKKTGKRGK